MGVFRSTLYDWLHADPELEKAWKSARESTIDFAEGKLLGNIKEGKETSIIFFLKTIGKKRGYIEKTESEVQVTHNEPMTIIYKGQELDIKK